jgi:hypothetical protein
VLSTLRPRRVSEAAASVDYCCCCLLLLSVVSVKVARWGPYELINKYDLIEISTSSAARRRRGDADLGDYYR